jgi:cell division protein ZapA
MAQVAITLNDRTYRLVCDDGEEDRLVELAGYVKARVERLRAELGHVGDERLMLMAALMIADELFDARASVVTAVPLTPTASVKPTSARGPSQAAAAEPEAVQRLRAIASKLGAERDAIGSDGAGSAVEVSVTAPAAKSRRRDVA